MNNINKKILYKKGFTLIETLVAITILMISIVGPLTIAQKSLNAATYARDQVTASFIAQEYMEKIKQEKNLYLGYGGSNSDFYTWTRGFNDFDNGKCRDSACQLKINESGTYTIDESVTKTSKFYVQYKIISPTKISAAVNTEEAIITVTVSWNNGTVQNTSRIESYIYNVSL